MSMSGLWLGADLYEQHQRALREAERRKRLREEVVDWLSASLQGDAVAVSVPREEVYVIIQLLTEE